MMVYIKFIISNLSTLLKEIPDDKLLHFFAGMIVFNLSISIAYLIGLNPIIFCTFMVFITAVAKELFDYCSNLMNTGNPKHTVDFMDFVATMLGVFPSIIFLLG